MKREYGLRTIKKDRTSYGGFVWPGGIGTEVVAPDWDPEPKCGGGIHFLPRGEGDASLLGDIDDIWQVASYAVDTAVNLNGKSKAPSVVIEFEGARDAAVKKLVELCPGAAVVYGVVTAGYGGVATAGDRGAATAGYGGAATAGYRGTATAGDRGAATAGAYGVATAGYRGTATAGDRGVIQINWWDAKSGRFRIATGYVGEDGIEPNVRYRLDENHKFVRAEGGAK